MFTLTENFKRINYHGIARSVIKRKCNFALLEMSTYKNVSVKKLLYLQIIK